jgi:hypothetical protein
MGVVFTAEAEKRRVEAAKNMRAKKVSWDMLRTSSMAEATRYARDHGWKQKKVQVRAERTGMEYEYVVEPFEKDCSCPNILKYSDYFD